MNNTLKIIIGLAVVCSASAVILIYKKYSKPPQETNELKITPKATKNIDAEYEFKNIYKKFEGNYEPLYLSFKDESNTNTVGKILKNWNRLIRYHSKGGMIKEWENLVSSCFENKTFNEGNVDGAHKMAEKWLEKLAKWGAERINEDEIVINDSTSTYYIISDAYECGEKAEVVRHCWIMKETGLLIEYGRVNPLE